MSVYLLFSIGWSLLLLAAYIGVQRVVTLRVQLVRYGIWAILLAALVSRLLPNQVLPVGAVYDIESYRIVGRLVRQGKDVYEAQKAENRYPYLPLQMYWSAFALYAADHLGVSFTKIVRLLPIAANTLLALVIYAWLKRRRPPRQAFLGGMLYALNPVAVFVSAYHGQFDSAALLASLLGLMATPGMPVAAGVLLGSGILIKSWPVILLPGALWSTPSWRQRGVLLRAALLAPLAAILVYQTWSGTSLDTILATTLGYNRGYGVIGYTLLLRMLSWALPATQTGLEALFVPARLITVVALGAVWWFWARRETALNSALTMLVAFVALSHAFAIQYLVWILPLGTIDAILTGKRSWLNRYTLAAFIYMVFVYHTIILDSSLLSRLPKVLYEISHMPLILPVWLVSLAWLWQRTAGNLRSHRMAAKKQAQSTHYTGKQ